MERLMVFLRLTGNILLVWLVWSLFYFFFASISNKDANYERIFYIIFTNLSSIAACYLFVKYVE